MVLSKMSWMVFGLGTLGLVGCGGAGWEQTAQEDAVGDESAALTANNKPAPRSFLSLGDSIPFGFNPLVPLNPPTNFIGYPEVLVSTGNKATNASCPGETSGSFLLATAPDNGCRAFKAGLALHADYETTQMAYFLSALKKTAFDFVTLNIGANDLFLLQASCATTTDPLGCIQVGLPGAIAAYAANLKEGLRQVKAAGCGPKLKGKFIGVTTYATNYNDPLAVGALTLLNNELVKFTNSADVGGKVADGFLAFQTEAARLGGGDACAAGLLIKKPDGTCDIHPSQTGRELLAKTVRTVANAK